MATLRPGIERVAAVRFSTPAGVTSAGVALGLALGLALALSLPSRPALGNARAPKVVPQAPSTAAFPIAAATDIAVVGEDLGFECETDSHSCTVMARYRLHAPKAVSVELAFVMPQPAPLTVTVGSGAAPTRVSAAPAGALRDEDLDPWERERDTAPLPKYQAVFTAPLAAGENTVTAAYQQPLGQYEHGHGYFSKGRFTDYFRYELWPLAEWRHAPGFSISGTLSIHRPPPSWWTRNFSEPRSIGCDGLEGVPHSLSQRGDELALKFKLADPLPKRLWCHIGDRDLVPN
jgi:hypothetical protein